MTALRIISFLDDVLIILGCRTSWYFKLSFFFLSAVVKVQVTSVFEKLFPIIENNVKVFYTYGWISWCWLLMLVDVDHWQQWSWVVRWHCCPSSVGIWCPLLGSVHQCRICWCALVMMLLSTSVDVDVHWCGCWCPLLLWMVMSTTVE